MRTIDQVKRLMRIMLAVLILALPAGAMAKRLFGISMIWTGTYIQDDPSKNLTGRCPETGCVGDLLSCGPSEVITITKKTFSYVARVCDDQTAGFPACDGRITALVEECAGPGDTISVGPLTSVNSTGKMRLCLDSGDCSGSAAAGVIGGGIMRSQMRFVSGSSPPSGTSMTFGSRHSRFVFEGKKARFYRGRRLVDFITAEPNDGMNCGGGCGVAGVSITDKS